MRNDPAVVADQRSPERTEASRRTGRAPVFVGAYAAAGRELDDAAEDGLVRSVLDAPGVAGLEVPLLEGQLHRRGNDWILDRLGSGDLVITLVTDAVARLKSDPGFGLAAVSPQGRNDAVEVARAALRSVHDVHERMGRPTVRAVEIHSAPSAPAPSAAAAFARSLAEIAEWDWQGAELLIEHCDAPREWGAAAKGFLEFSEEIEVVRSLRPTSRTPLGVMVNWGRSAIEGRSPHMAVDHIATAEAAGLLRAVTFSGCTDRSDVRGGPWADVHLPVADPVVVDDPSLLDGARIEQSLHAAARAEPLFVGLKVSAAPGASARRRTDTVLRSLELLSAARAEPACPVEGD
uniref:DUF4862 family protein n=1 Tax=Streptomyces sp. NBC_01401 TaxID=2903854 RepID=A0AAU3GQT7_9ACTN